MDIDRDDPGPQTYADEFFDAVADSESAPMSDICGISESVMDSSSEEDDAPYHDTTENDHFMSDLCPPAQPLPAPDPQEEAEIVQVVPASSSFPVPPDQIHNTAQFYTSHLDWEVHEGAGQTLRQWLFTRVSQKIASNATDEAFEIDLRIRRYEAEKYCNLQCVIMPTSMYMVRRILGVPELWEREYHICPCENEAWEPLPPNAWFHPDDVRSSGPAYECRVCKGKRFTVEQQPSGRTTVKPKLVRVPPCLLSLCMAQRLNPL